MIDDGDRVAVMNPANAEVLRVNLDDLARHNHHERAKSTCLLQAGGKQAARGPDIG